MGRAAKYTTLTIYLSLLLSTSTALAQHVGNFDLQLDALNTHSSLSRFEHRAMGTEFNIMLYPRPGEFGFEEAQQAAQEAFDAIDQLESNISSWIASSSTSKVNREAHAHPVSVTSDVFRLFETSLHLFKETSGIFDITVGPLIDLWKEPLKQGTRPDADKLANILNQVGSGNIRLNRKLQTISFKKSGMRVSFGGIGKGLAMDEAAAVLKRHGVTSALLSGGDSSMLAIGAPPGNSVWKIGIHDPYNTSESVAIVELRDQALSTSACYQHLEGVTGRPCGIFDPRTGEPTVGMVSATVIAPSGMLTDALSTTFYVMGIEGARNYCAQHPEISAVLLPDPDDGKLEPVYIGKQIRNDQE